jgi:hypothetical protein
MLIRRAQFEAFSEATRHTFQTEMVAHLMTFSPAHCPGLGEHVVGDLVRLGIDRAADYGFTTRGPVRFYLELMIQLGTDFHSDPQLAYVSGTLNQPDVGSQQERAERLYERAMNYIDAVIGPRQEYELQALARAEQLTLEELSRAAEQSADAWLSLFSSLYPQKFHYAGEDAARAMIESGRKEAEVRSLSDARAPLILAGLMYTFGHHSLTDPQFPWIADGLSDRSRRDPGRAVERLFSIAIAYFKESLRVLRQRS